MIARTMLTATTIRNVITIAAEHRPALALDELAAAAERAQHARVLDHRRGRGHGPDRDQEQAGDDQQDEADRDGDAEQDPDQDQGADVGRRRREQVARR